MLGAIRERIRTLGPLSNSIHVLYHFDIFAPWAILVLQVEISWAIIISRNFVDQRTLSTNGPPGVLGIWGEGLFIFRELGSTANYFRGAGEQAHTFVDLRSTAKKVKKINMRLHFI